MKNENEFEKRPFISALLIFVAFMMMSVIWFVLIIAGIVIYWFRDELTTYLYRIGVAIDQLLATMIWNTEDHTISAIAFKNKYERLVNFINWLFRDESHCRESYVKEYIMREEFENEL